MIFHDSIQLALWVIAGLLLVRQGLVMVAAEQGRKQDLVKKLYKNTQEFQLSILIPFLDANHHPALLNLLQAIAEQEYPAAKVAVHLVATESTHHELIPQSLRPNVKVWQYPTTPQGDPRYGQAITWLIERCLAAGGNGMFVFLKPTDIIKPDFFQNVVARGIDSFAVQGYVALKNPPETPLAKMVALSTRLFNRIGNAGRYHLGLSCRLLDSGWAIKQEVLEMIPFKRGMDLDNLEYSIRLNLENFRVNWAPSVVIYADSDVPFVEHVTLCAGAFFNRLRLLIEYGPRLLTRMLMRFDFNYLEQLISTISPPYFLTFILVAVLAWLDTTSKIQIPGSDHPPFWLTMAVATLVLNALELLVARCKANDFAGMLVFTPVTYLLGLLASPLALFNVARETLGKRPPRGSRYRIHQKTRFNEELEARPSFFEEDNQNVIRNVLKKNAPQEMLLDEAFDPLPPRKAPKNKPSRKTMAEAPPRLLESPGAVKQEAEADEALITSRMKLPRETVKAVPLAYGDKQVNCLLKTLTTFDEAGQEYYKLTLEYKSVAFSTESYRILDQAYYELQAKLMGRGLTIMTCGSCGNFYNPTADVPGALKNAGVCLFGKQGKEVNLTTDAVTVISQACAYHCPLAERESIVRQWKDSLTLSRSK